MAEVVEDCRIDNLLDRDILHILDAEKAEVDRSDFCPNGMRYVHLLVATEGKSIAW